MRQEIFYFADTGELIALRITIGRPFDSGLTAIGYCMISHSTAIVQPTPSVHFYLSSGGIAVPAALEMYT